jgi:hypothetical protein
MHKLLEHICCCTMSAVGTNNHQHKTVESNVRHDFDRLGDVWLSSIIFSVSYLYTGSCFSAFSALTVRGLSHNALVQFDASTSNCCHASHRWEFLWGATAGNHRFSWNSARTVASRCPDRKGLDRHCNRRFWFDSLSCRISVDWGDQG